MVHEEGAESARGAMLVEAYIDFHVALTGVAAALQLATSVPCIQNLLVDGGVRLGDADRLDEADEHDEHRSDDHVP